MNRQRCNIADVRKIRHLPSRTLFFKNFDFNKFYFKGVKIELEVIRKNMQSISFSDTVFSKIDFTANGLLRDHAPAWVLTLKGIMSDDL